MTSKFYPAFFLVVVCNVLLCIPSQAAPPISFAGGDGSSEEKAVIIKGGNEETGVQAEYSYLAKHFPGYKLGEQAVVQHGKRNFDQLDFLTARGEKKTIFFDITAFYGKVN